MSYFGTDDNEDFKVGRIVKTVIGVAAAFIILANFPVGTVSAGERGVRLRFNAVTGAVVPEGLYFRIPFVERVKKMDVRIQKDEVEASAASKDLQTVSAKVAVNYHLAPDSVVSVYKDIGTEYNARLIAPALQETVKAVTAQFTADQLITKRGEVRDGIKGLLAEKLTPRGIIVDDFNIVNFDFSNSFNKAIEDKVTAEQNALASKNKLEQSKYEAEQRVAQAKGEAEAIRIQAAAIQNQGGAEYVQLKAIEKWDGTVPTYTGTGTVPFINLK